MTIIDYPFVASDVALYHRHLSDPDNALDSQTWDDMLLPAYSAELACETSILGQQELHRRLHTDGGRMVATTVSAAATAAAATGATAADTAAAVAEAATAPVCMPSATRVRALLADDALRRQLQTACTGLRSTDREISETLYGPELAPSPRWVSALAWLPMVFLLSAGIALGTGWLWLWGVALIAWLALMAIQMRYHEPVQEWERILNTTRQMLRTHSLLAQIDHATAAMFSEDSALAGRLNRRLSRSLLAQIPLMRDYGDWLWLQNVRHYFHSREAVRGNLGQLRSIFERVAALEADLALARHLSRTSVYCWAERGDEVTLEQVVHPLLTDAAPLTFGMQRQGVFVSGQNGVGKSTLLRTLGLNLITARAFGFCYAARAVTPGLPVYSSMQNEDAMSSGESFYLAELRRARELLALADARPAIFLIDEIFRGTNYLESVSAAAAVLQALARQGRLVVASHHLVLASLLSDCLQPWCVSRADGVLQLSQGLLQHTNGLTLLSERGFAPVITAKADRIHAWLSDYMAHPDCDLAQLTS